MRARCLMLQGTASGVGKSLLTAALCRIFARRGYRVAPFKAQNMALNAAVTADGGEIGRAQAAQAEAAGVEPSVDMNPILLKPEADNRSQVVVRGVAIGSMSFAEYRRRRAELLSVVGDSLERLRRTHDLVLIEGAGSPAEVNLADGEIVNMCIARLAEAPVLLVGDIDRGGVFAAFVGTLELLKPVDRARVVGFIVNKFRGDPDLLELGLSMLLARTGVPVLGVVPYLDSLLVPAEDSQDLDRAPTSEPALVEIVVVRSPRIANFDDFEPLAREPGVRVRFARSRGALEDADLIVLPGSKSTMADLAWLRENGLAAALEMAAQRGTPVLGICGGYQMLGHALLDPHGVESPVASAPGLGLLPAVTTFAPLKRTTRVRARVTASVGPLGGAAGAALDAYEIHAGVTAVSGGGPWPFRVTERNGRPVRDLDGAMRPDGLVIGTYLHGLFASAELRRALLGALAERGGLASDPRWGTAEEPGARYERLADAVASALDIGAVAKLAGL